MISIGYEDLGLLRVGEGMIKREDEVFQSGFVRMGPVNCLCIKEFYLVDIKKC